MAEPPCTFCGTPYSYNDQWWIFNGYHGIHGKACPTCHEDLRYQAGKPAHPKRFQKKMVIYKLRMANEF